MTGLDPDLLLAHRGFIRAIARRLARDAADADDAAQDACLAALAHAPDSPRAARSWLATIARRFVLRARRDASLHARKLERLPPPELPPSPQEVLGIER